MIKICFCLLIVPIVFSSHKTIAIKKSCVNEHELVATLQQHIVQLKQFCKNKHYDTSVCFLIDMSIPNGKNRFFIYDWKLNKITNEALVAHGNSTDTFYQPKVKFSNAINSNCSSNGRYKIGASYYGKFGLAYKLYGLDSSNSNAFSRSVVLHAHSCVPDKEIFPNMICNSLGCPTVSPNFLKTIQLKLSKTKQPVVLWVY